MKVNEIQEGSSVRSLGSVSLEPDDGFSQSDAQWFQAALNDPSPAKGNVQGAPDILSSLTGAISDNQRDQQQALRGIAKASRSTNPMELGAASAVMSDYYIQSLMNAKIISKSIQGLDKLTNLQ